MGALNFFRYICSKTIIGAVQIWTSTPFSVVQQSAKFSASASRVWRRVRSPIGVCVALYAPYTYLEKRENQDLLFGDHDDRLSVFFIRSLPSWRFRAARSSPNLAVSGLSPHKHTRSAGRTEKKPSFQRKTAQCSKLPVFYFRIAKSLLQHRLEQHSTRAKNQPRGWNPTRNWGIIVLTLWGSRQAMV